MGHGAYAALLVNLERLQREKCVALQSYAVVAIPSIYQSPSMGGSGETPMTRAQHDYDDIPGTFVFDAERSREGYHLNMFCMSLMKAENRKAFKEDEAKYLDRFPLTPEQREAILKRQYNRILELGGNIYFTAKLGATDGHSFQHMAAVMTNSTQEDYAKMMLDGGRSVEGNRSKSGKSTKSKSGKSGKKRG
jgi:protocatechuate 4,5-dioxygenase, alpha chain